MQVYLSQVLHDFIYIKLKISPKIPNLFFITTITIFHFFENSTINLQLDNIQNTTKLQVELCRVVPSPDTSNAHDVERVYIVITVLPKGTPLPLSPKASDSKKTSIRYQ